MMRLLFEVFEPSCFVRTNLNVWKLMLKMYIAEMESSRFRQSHARVEQYREQVTKVVVLTPTSR